MKILYLYHDLMNLYGDSGNLRVLERRLTGQGEEVTVDRRTLGDALDFTGYDFLYHCIFSNYKRTLHKHAISCQ